MRLARVSPGPMSGIMAMRQLNFILNRLGARTVPVHLGIGNAKTAFDDEGQLKSEMDVALVEKLCARLMAGVT